MTSHDIPFLGYDGVEDYLDTLTNHVVNKIESQQQQNGMNGNGVLHLNGSRTTECNGNQNGHFKDC